LEVRCPLCGNLSTPDALDEALWLPIGAITMMESLHPGWQLGEGACPSCVQRALVEMLILQAEVRHQDRILAAWPLNAETAYGVLPTPLRLHVDPRYRGQGVTMAFIDAAFYPHPDLVRPRNRIRAWVDASTGPVHAVYYDREDTPQWPGWDDADPSQWHGMMTSSAAAGNGWMSHGLYRGLASEADVVLVQVRGPQGGITNDSITRGLRWLRDHGPGLGVKVVSVSVAGRNTEWHTGNPVDEAVEALVEAGITVVTASGNEGERRLVPPATAPHALTIGGIDDRNNFDPAEVDVWHSSYGDTVSGQLKPELVAPSIWVVAPVLPGSGVAAEARRLFQFRHIRDLDVEFRIAEQKLVTPHYQHVQGTSFAAPLVSSVIACMLEANPALTPQKVREILIRTAQPVVGADRERQGAGAIVSSLALAEAMREEGGPLEGIPLSPQVDASGVTFWLYDNSSRQVHVRGSWDDWSAPGIAAEQVRPCVWRAHMPPLDAGRYGYKFLLDGWVWLDDPDNPRKEPNGYGSFNTILEI